MSKNQAIGPLKFGMFMSPIHAPEQNPTLQLQHDLDLITHLDSIGFDEAWVGEHHSTGYEIVGCPELMLAVAAERTKHIRLGTGVVSLPYHHPFMVADRICLLDHLTRGRVIFGVGHGSLPFDAYMMGIDEDSRRERWAAALEAIMALLKGEVVTRETAWFTLQEARLHLLPYQADFEVAVASASTPTGARLAGRFGASLLTISPPTSADASALTQYWEVCAEEATKHGQTVSRADWRIVGGVMHLAETEKQAREEITTGLTSWLDYVGGYVPFLQQHYAGGATEPEDIIEGMIESGFAIVGTPDRALTRIRSLLDASGGFGTYLVWDTDWASPVAKRRSYELFAQHVIPAFRPTTSARLESTAWGAAMRSTLDEKRVAAREKATAAQPVATS